MARDDDQFAAVLCGTFLARGVCCKQSSFSSNASMMLALVGAGSSCCGGCNVGEQRAERQLAAAAMLQAVPRSACSRWWLRISV